VESVLLEHPSLSEAVVIAREDVPGDKRLVAYVVGSDIAAAELRDYLTQRAPEYMIPSAFVRLDELPLTTNGKVDRKALPAPEGRNDEILYVAPRNPEEELLAQIWSEVLRVERVGIEDDFFELGGDSIRALRVQAEVQKHGYDLALKELFRLRRIAALAPVTHRRASRPQPAAPLSLISAADRARIEQAGYEDAYPLSMLQAGMVFHNLWERGSSTYHDVISQTLQLRLDEGALPLVLQEAVNRHATLRTTFHLNEYEQPLQCVRPQMPACVQIEDWTDCHPQEQRARLKRFVNDESRSEFDLSNGPLVKFFAFRLNREEFQFLLSIHHALTDGWSVATLLSEIYEDYLARLQGNPFERRPALSMQYRDYIAQEQAALKNEEHKQYWEEIVKVFDRSALWRLPAPTHATPAHQEDTSENIASPFLPEMARGVVAFARQTGVPVKSVLFGAYLNALRAFTGGREARTGLVTNARPEGIDAEKVLGLFLNTVPVRFESGSGNWQDLAREAMWLEEEILQHRVYPVVEIYRRYGGRNVLDVIFNYINYHVLGSVTERVSIKGSAGAYQTNFPLIVNVNFDTQSQHGSWLIAYNVARFSREQAQKFADLYLSSLKQLIEYPQEQYTLYSLVPQPDQALLNMWNATAQEYPRRCVHELFSEQAARTPSAVAVRFQNQTFSYAELEARSNQLARHLVSLGVGSDAIVGLAVERSIELVVGLLGILKAGGAYLPLDLEYPPERLAFMLKDAAVAVLLVQEKSAGVVSDFDGLVLRLDEDAELFARHSGEALPNRTDAEMLAYVMYTSGSTGTPKGVSVTHDNIVRLIKGNSPAPITAQDVMLQLAPLAFDASTFEIWGALLNGARLVLYPGGRDLSPLKGLLAREQVSVLWLTAGLFHWMVDEGLSGLDSLRTWIAGGDALSAPHVRKVLAQLPHCRLINGYGPTECSTFSAWHVVGELDAHATSVPIGKPLANVRCYVLDENQDLAPLGVIGELYIGGAGVARGYLNRPALTAERFIPNPFAGADGSSASAPGERLYCTGDLVRRNAAGELEFVGRVDHQVKIRGFRIEPGEVETALLSLAAVGEAVVLARDDTPGEKRLVAYWVPAGGFAADGSQVGEPALVSSAPARIPASQIPQAAELRAYLAQRLPEHLIPSAFVVLEQMPLTVNGKVDRKALSALQLDAKGQSEYVAPHTAAERALVDIWEAALKRAPIGIHDNFFELGGDSILSTRIVLRANTAGFRISIKDIFAHPTIHEMAQHCAHAPEHVRAVPAIAALNVPASSWEPSSAPLTTTQLDQWWIYLQTGSVWPVDLEFEIEGPVARELLEGAINATLRRHQAFWARISERVPVQRFVTPHDVKLPFFDLTNMPDEEQSREIDAIASDCRMSTLRDLPLMKARLIKTDAARYLLLLGFTHLVVDGASVGVVLQDIARAYDQLGRGESVHVRPPLQISQVARAERIQFAGPPLKRSIAFWHAALRGMRPYALPKSFFASESEDGSPVALVLPKSRFEHLRRLSTQYGVTLQVIVTALVCMALHRAGGSPDVVLKVFLSGRDSVEDDDEVVAPLYREQILRIQMAEPTFDSVVGVVKSFMVAALEHQDCPYIIPVSLLHLSKWPAPMRALVPLWKIFSVLLTRTLLRSAALYPKMLANLAASAEFPGKRRTSRLPSGEMGCIVDVNINMLLQQSRDLMGLTLHGTGVSPSKRDRRAALKRKDWGYKTLDITFAEDTNGHVIIGMTGGEITEQGHRKLLELLMEQIDSTSSVEAVSIKARRAV